MKKIIKTSLGLGILALVTFSSSVHAATSDTTVAEVTIQSGQMSLTAPEANVTFSPITVDNSVQVRNIGFSNPLIVEDLTGTGTGWNVTVQASQFVETSGSLGLTLPSNTLKLQAPISVTPAAAGPTVSPSAPWTIDGTAVKILSAAPGDGMGTFDVAFSGASALQLSVDTSGSVVDPSSNPTTFESTITWQISTGP
jgi:hypothetical protein